MKYPDKTESQATGQGVVEDSEVVEVGIVVETVQEEEVVTVEVVIEAAEVVVTTAGVAMTMIAEVEAEVGGDSEEVTALVGVTGMVEESDIAVEIDMEVVIDMVGEIDMVEANKGMVEVIGLGAEIDMVTNLNPETDLVEIETDMEVKEIGLEEIGTGMEVGVGEIEIDLLDLSGKNAEVMMTGQLGIALVVVEEEIGEETDTKMGKTSRNFFKFFILKYPNYLSKIPELQGKNFQFTLSELQIYLDGRIVKILSKQFCKS